MNAQSETAEKVDEAVTGVTSWWNDPETQDILIQRPLKILLIIVVALVLNWLARRIIHRATRRGIERTPLLASEAEDTPQYRAQEARRQQRMRTLGNVGRSVAVIVIWTWAALAVLVKDFFSGMFILIENQFGVGDTIQVGDIVGEVEMMTLRITTIRDMDGALWHVRNGDIDQVGNHSARFSTARLQIPVSLMADPDKVSRVIEDTAVAACRDPEIRDVVMGTPAMLGPSEFNPTYVSFRLTVQTMPGQQWAVARHLNHRILAALHQKDVVLTAMDSVLVEMKENRGDQS